MSPQTIQSLNRLNVTFYARQAKSFDATRQNPWSGWEHFLPYLPKEPLSVLDVGCGNGRFEQFLVTHDIPISHYSGVDLSSELIQRAWGQNPHDLHTRTFKQLDICQPDSWSIFKQKYDVVALLALLHHIPSLFLRKKLLSRAAAALNPGGLLLLSLWHYEVDPRFSQKVMPWKLQPQIHPDDLEAGDYLLSWQNDPSKLRYAHVFQEHETLEYIQSSRLALVHEFHADGVSHNLNHYLMLRSMQGRIGS
jgi:2-polyprenyl-3-methyl-5-hydroxy-6-metoxy-1,4-benzoquinol methylase